MPPKSAKRADDAKSEAELERARRLAEELGHLEQERRSALEKKKGEERQRRQELLQQRRALLQHIQKTRREVAQHEKEAVTLKRSISMLEKQELVGYKTQHQRHGKNEDVVRKLQTKESLKTLQCYDKEGEYGQSKIKAMHLRAALKDLVASKQDAPKALLDVVDGLSSASQRERSNEILEESIQDMHNETAELDDEKQKLLLELEDARRILKEAQVEKSLEECRKGCVGPIVLDLAAVSHQAWAPKPVPTVPPTPLMASPRSASTTRGTSPGRGTLGGGLVVYGSSPQLHGSALGSTVLSEASRFGSSFRVPISLNRAGAPMSLGTEAGAATYYCGRATATGRCGPHSGVACSDCRLAQEDLERGASVSVAASPGSSFAVYPGLRSPVQQHSYAIAGKTGPATYALSSPPPLTRSPLASPASVSALAASPLTTSSAVLAVPPAALLDARQSPLPCSRSASAIRGAEPVAQAPVPAWAMPTLPQGSRSESRARLSVTSDLFGKLDLNSDGQVTREEFKEAIKERGVHLSPGQAISAQAPLAGTAASY